MFHNLGYPQGGLLFIYFRGNARPMPLDLDQLAHLRRMVEGGYPQKSIAVKLQITRRMVRRIMFDLGLRLPKKPPRHRRQVNDFKLQEVPLEDRYRCTVGPDRYLEALKRHFPERIP